MTKERKILIENETDLERAALLGNHHRKEQILDAITTVFVWAIFMIPGILFVIGIMYFYHLYVIDDWATIAFYGKEATKFVGYIALGILIQMRILPKDMKIGR